MKEAFEKAKRHNTSDAEPDVIWFSWRGRNDEDEHNQCILYARKNTIVDYQLYKTEGCLFQIVRYAGWKCCHSAQPQKLFRRVSIPLKLLQWHCIVKRKDRYSVLPRISDKNSRSSFSCRRNVWDRDKATTKRLGGLDNKLSLLVDKKQPSRKIAQNNNYITIISSVLRLPLVLLETRIPTATARAHLLRHLRLTIKDARHWFNNGVNGRHWFARKYQLSCTNR